MKLKFNRKTYPIEVEKNGWYWLVYYKTCYGSHNTTPIIVQALTRKGAIEKAISITSAGKFKSAILRVFKIKVMIEV